MNKKFLLTLSTGHACTDLNQGALPVMLPFLMAAGGLSFASAAGLTFAMALSSSVVQPLFGLWADKISKPWLMPVGILLAGSGTSLIGYCSSYEFMFLAAIISGIGIAAFHPEAARFANQAAGEKKGAGMSIFSVGGNLGFALGPILTLPALLAFGIKGTAVIAIPTLLMSVLLYREVRKSHPQLKIATTAIPTSSVTQKDEWGKFSWLTLAIIARSIVFHSLNTFLPLYWIFILYQSESVSGTALTILLATGAASTLAGGFLADRLGANKVVQYGFLILAPSLYFFTTTESPMTATLLLLPIAFGLFSISGPLVLLGQKYLPNKIGFASGVTLGLAVSIGGLVAPLLGSYADQNGLLSAFHLLLFLPILGSIVALTLKPPSSI